MRFSDMVSFDETIHGSVNPWDDDDNDDDIGPDDPVDSEDPRSPRPAPAVWLAQDLVTRTEAALRLHVACHLLTSHLATADVRVRLTGHELLVRDRPRFPVVRFLRERGCERGIHQGAPHQAAKEWRGHYIMKGVPHALVLHSELTEPDVVAPLPNGARLIAHVNRGRLTPTHSPGEHKLLRAALGHALTYPRYAPTDFGAAVVPRPPRFRMLANKWRDAPALVRAGPLILTVDRAGNVDGLKSLEVGPQVLFIKE
jgi:hypothetical protein